MTLPKAALSRANDQSTEDYGHNGRLDHLVSGGLDCDSSCSAGGRWGSEGKENPMATLFEKGAC